MGFKGAAVPGLLPCPERALRAGDLSRTIEPPWVSVWGRQCLSSSIIEIDGIRTDQHLIPRLGEWRHMFNFLVIQAGSPGWFLCAHGGIAAAERRLCSAHAALHKSCSLGLQSPASLGGEGIKAISPAFSAEFPWPRTPRETARMLEAQGSGWALAADLFPPRFFPEGCAGRGAAGGEGWEQQRLTAGHPLRTAQGRDLGAFRPVQKVSFTGECFPYY